MVFKIRSVDINYDDNNTVIAVNVRFDFNDNFASINGFVRLTEADYLANSSTTDVLATYVKGLIVTKINA